MGRAVSAFSAIADIPRRPGSNSPDDEIRKTKSWSMHRRAISPRKHAQNPHIT